MIDPVIYRLLKQMATTAGLAIPNASVPLSDSSWVLFFTKLEGHVT